MLSINNNSIDNGDLFHDNNRINIYYDNDIIFNNYINRDNYYFNNNNKLNEGAKKLYNILDNFRNLNRDYRIDFERSLGQVFNNRNIFSDINNIFREMGFSKDKTIKFLIFKFIVSVSGTKMNDMCNEIAQTKNDLDMIKHFYKKKNLLEKNYANLSSSYCIQKEKLDILQELTNKVEQSIPLEAKCSICISNTKSHVIVPCGHKSICGECAPHILQTGICPICRTPIESIIKVFEA